MSVELWQQCVELLRDELPAQQFNTWIRPLQVEAEGDELRVYAPNRFVLDWVNEKYMVRLLELLAERANDLKDVSRRVLRRLTGTSGDPDISPPLPERAVVVAEDLTPSETAGLDPMRVVGLVTAAGGPTAHTAILARALGIPAIVAAGPAVMELPDGTPVIVDGDRGLLRPDPDAAQLAAAERAIATGRDRAAAARAPGEGERAHGEGAEQGESGGRHGPTLRAL